MRLRASPALHRLEVALHLPHPNLRWKERVDERLMQEEGVWSSLGRTRDARPKAKDCLDTCERPYAHAKTDDNEIGKARKINGFAFHETHPGGSSGVVPQVASHGPTEPKT